MSPPASAPGASTSAGRCCSGTDRCCRASSRSSACRRKSWSRSGGWSRDFGKGDIGKMPVIRTLATMAHDCRRTELFQGELLAALKIVQRGDLPLRDLIGAFAGEIGQTQFLPSSYIKYGVDFDGNGHVDLRHSVPDVLASTANLLHAQRLQGRRALRRGHREFRSDARVEQGDDLPQDDRVFCRQAGGAVRASLLRRVGKGAQRRAHHFTTCATLDGGHASLCPPYGLRRMGRAQQPIATRRALMASLRSQRRS